MIVRQFLLWAQTAPPGQRAEALGALARAYLYGHLSPLDRAEAETAMTAFLDDPSPLVRRALAEAVANAAEAPRHIVVALANDQSDIAARVLARSTLLSEADLVDCAALGDELTQTAIASRPYVPVSVSAALAEIAAAGPLVTLAKNSGAVIAELSLARMVERHGKEAELREALLARSDLPLSIRQTIAVALSESLASFVRSCGWLTAARMERVVQEAKEKATVALSSEATREDVARLVAHLRSTGQLTPGLILRAMLSRAQGFVEAALAELTGLPAERVAGLLWDRRGAGGAALLRKAGLPDSLLLAFEAALTAWREGGRDPLEAAGAQLSRRMVERVLSACETLAPDEAARLLALLRRFEAEAARDEARKLASALADEAALATVLEHAPDMLDRPALIAQVAA